MVRWFGHEDFALSQRTWPAATPSETAIGNTKYACRATTSARGKRAIIEAALAVDLASVPLNGPDRAVIDNFADRIILDLVSQLGPSNDWPLEYSQRWCTLTIKLNGDDIITLCLPESVQINAVKTACRREQHERSQLVSRYKALGATALRVEGFLGKGALSLYDLDTMAPGDVLVLDRSVHSGAALRLAGGQEILANGRLERADDKPSIHF
jgi:hypothetical protein